MGKKEEQLERIIRMNRLIEKQTGKHVVRPFRADGYVNLMNKYGTQRDATEQYYFQAEDAVPDELLTQFYEGNGLFAKIIDAPAEEAIKHGFKIKDLADQKLEDFYTEALDELDWEQVFSQSIKWQRLFGGAIAVMLINDNRGLEEPLDWKNIQSIDDIVVYDRSVIQADTSSVYQYDSQDPFRSRGSRLGSPEYYQVQSRRGSFTVHESRVLEFRNGVLPENTSNMQYQLWGLPEYLRINRAIRDAEVAHGSASKLLDRSIQAVYKMKDLSALLSTDEGTDLVLQRMQVIDMARGMLNSIVIDSEGEEYDFRSFSFAGVSDVINTTCDFLSSLTSIPQTVLFGRAPTGFSSNDDTALENWYSYVERIQKNSMRSNLRYLLSVIFCAGYATGEIDKIPPIKIEFNPLKVLSEDEQLDIELKRIQVQQARANVTMTYVENHIIDTKEVRKALGASEEFDVEEMLDDYETEEELMENMPEQEEDEEQGAGGMMPMATPSPEQAGHEPAPEKKAEPQPEEASEQKETQEEESEEKKNSEPGEEGSAPGNAPAATKLPQDMTEEEKEKAEEAKEKRDKDDEEEANGDDETEDDLTDNSNDEDEDYHSKSRLGGVGVICVKDGKILCGTRHNDTGYGLLCGPGGHIEDGETPEQAAIRETVEEFSIKPTSLISLGYGPTEEDGNYPEVFLCTEWDGEPKSGDLEIVNIEARGLEEIYAQSAMLFKPFADGLELLIASLENEGIDDSEEEPTQEPEEAAEHPEADEFINTALSAQTSDKKNKEEEPDEQDDEHVSEEKPLDIADLRDKVSLRNFILQFAKPERSDASGQRENGEWVTWNGTHLLLDSERNIVKGPDHLIGKSYNDLRKETKKKERYSGNSPDGEKREPEDIVAASKPSARGGNLPCIGFEHDNTLRRKVIKHVGYKGMSFEEFENTARELLMQPCGGDIDGFLESDGAIVRFNRKTGDMAVGYPGGYIKTMFKPGQDEKDKKKPVSIAKAIRKFESIKKRDSV